MIFIYILFAVIGYLIGIYYGFLKNNNFHGPESKKVKKLKFYNPNDDKFYKLKPQKIKH